MAVLQDLFTCLQPGNSKGLISVRRQFENTLFPSPWQSDIAETAPINSATVCNLLDVFYDEKVSDTAKCHLLINMEENLTAFALTKTSASQLAQSLLNVVKNSRTNQANPPRYAGLVLQCISSIMVQFDVVLSEDNVEVTRELVGTLLEFVASRSFARHIRYRAMVCLQLLEDQYPTLLSTKLDHLVTMVKTEKTMLLEAAMTLLLTVMKNAVRFWSCKGKECPGLLDKQGERFSFFSPPIGQLVKAAQFLSIARPSQCIPLMCTDLSAVLRFCMDQSGMYMTILGQVYAVRMMADILFYVADDSPLLFKTVAYRYMNTANAAMLEALLLLRSRFGEDLFGSINGQEDELLESVVSHVLSPKLSIPHRLLASHWLSIYPKKKGSTRYPDFPFWAVKEEEERHPYLTPGDPQSDSPIEFLTASHMMALLPRIFDPMDVKHLKLKILNLRCPVGSETDGCSSLMFNALQGLRKQVQYRGTGRASNVLLRVMFAMHTRHANCRLPEDLKQLLLSLTYEHMSLTPHVLHYLRCVDKTLSPNCPDHMGPLTRTCLTQLADYVCDHVSWALHQPRVLPHYMAVLAQAAQLETSKVKVILDVLHRVVKETGVCDQGDWLKGHMIIDICKAVMHHHDTREHYTDLGNILHYMRTRFKELDVADRADIMYNMLTRLSSDKVKDIFNTSVDVPSSEVTIAGQNLEGFPAVKPPETLDFPVLSLTKVVNVAERRTHTKSFYCDDYPALTDEELWSKYELFLSKSEFLVRLTFSLERTEAARDLGVFYFPEVHFDALLEGVEADPWTPPTFDREFASSEPTLLMDLDLHNVDSSGFSLLPRIDFTKSDASIVYSTLDVIDLDLSDLFLPWPVQERELQTPLLRVFSAKKKCEWFVVSFFSEDSWQEFLTFFDTFKVFNDPLQYLLFLSPQHHAMLKVTPVEGLTYRLDMCTDLDMQLLVDMETFLKRFDVARPVSVPLHN